MRRARTTVVPVVQEGSWWNEWMNVLDRYGFISCSCRRLMSYLSPHEVRSESIPPRRADAHHHSVHLHRPTINRHTETMQIEPPKVWRNQDKKAFLVEPCKRRWNGDGRTKEVLIQTQFGFRIEKSTRHGEVETTGRQKKTKQNRMTENKKEQNIYRYL